MYLTVWQKLPNGYDEGFDDSWSKNLRDSDNYYGLVLEDCEAHYKQEIIRGYLVRQYAVSIDDQKLYLLH